MNKSAFILTGLMLCGLICSTLQAQVSLPGQPYENSHFIKVDSITFHYRTWNEDLPSPRGKIVIIHGFYGSSFCYRKNFDTLTEQGYRIVSVDLPGYGYSDRNPEINQSQSNRARFLWDLLDTLDRGDTTRWNLMGHSMGGGTVEAMALMRPARTKSLMIIDGMVFSKTTNMMLGLSSLIRMKGLTRVQVRMTEKKITNYDYMERKLKKAYGRPPDSSEVLGYYIPLQAEGTAAAVVSNFDNAKEVAKLRSDSLPEMPLILVWGSDDNTIPYSVARQFKRSHKWAETVRIEGAAHIPMETHPGEFNRIAVEFLNKSNPSPSAPN
jgi:pimeloyl-ACP methyl ester carboxylesterase